MGSFRFSWSSGIGLIVLAFGLMWGVTTLGVPQVQGANACEQTCSKDDLDESQYLTCINEKRSCLESKIKEFQSQKVTLSNTLSLISGRVAVQELQIKQTESEVERLQREIIQLTERIEGLNLSLDRLSAILVERIQSHYRASRVSRLLNTLSGENLSDALT